MTAYARSRSLFEWSSVESLSDRDKSAMTQFMAIPTFVVGLGLGGADMCIYGALNTVFWRASTLYNRPRVTIKSLRLSPRSLAKLTGYARNTVMHSLANLARLGLILVEVREGKTWITLPDPEPAMFLEHARKVQDKFSTLAQDCRDDYDNENTESY